MSNYGILLEKTREFFNVNDILRSDLNRIALQEHHITLDTLIDNWCRSNADSVHFNSLVNYLDELNSEPHCMTEMEEMYDFVYEYGGC